MASLGLVTILPLIVISYFFPSFTKLLVESTKEDAVRVARHFASQFVSEKEILTKASFEKIAGKEIETLKNDFELAKLKVFSQSGEAIFSTDPEDIGKLHKNSSIQEVIKNREIYAEIVHKGSETSEGQKMTSAVVETYVPLIDKGRLLGVFEVYYDITARKLKLDKLLIRTVLVLFGLAFGLFIFVVIILFKENKSMTMRKRAEDALYESEVRFRTFFRTSPDAITISRLRDGLIVNVNNGFISLSGYAKKDVLGKSTLDMDLWHDPDDRERMISELRENGKLDNFEAKFKRKGGHVIDALVSARMISLNQEPLILSVTRDISELKKTEKVLLASQNFLQISNRNRLMNSLLNEFINEIKQMTDCSSVGMRVLDSSGNIPYLAHEGFSAKFYESENPHAIHSMDCLCSDVVLGKIKIKPRLVTEGGSLCIGSASNQMATLSEAHRSQICDVCSTYGYESVALIPIRMADRILGMIHLADERKDIFSPEMITILEGAAMQLGTAIERVLVQEALQESHKELERRVQERTTQLVTTNELLNLEIEERKFNEKKLLEHQDKLRSLSSALLLTEERERRRIATELHDRIGQNLAITKIKLGGLRETLASNKADAKSLDNILGIIEQTIQDTRSLTFELSPPVLYMLGLEAALAWLADQTGEKHGLRVEFKDDGKPKPLDKGCRVTAFQAARELLFNTVKHARAQNTTISIKRDENAVCIDIEDDGIGFDSSEIEAIETGSKGFGLFSIRERLGRIGGHLEIKSEPGRGTRASLVLPLVDNNEDSGA